MSIILIGYIAAGFVWACIVAAFLPYAAEPKEQFRTTEVFVFCAILGIMSALIWPVMMALAIATMVVYRVSLKLRPLAKRLIKVVKA